MSLLTPSESAYGRCDAHHGRHGTYLGGCVLMGSEAPRPFTFRAGGNCGVCGVEIDLRYERGKRTAAVLVAGTDTPHGHSQAVVALDADELAAAIVSASRASRSERQPHRAADSPQLATAVTQPQRQAEAVAAGGEIPSVAVWSPGDGDRVE